VGLGALGCSGKAETLTPVEEEANLRDDLTNDYCTEDGGLPIIERITLESKSKDSSLPRRSSPASRKWSAKSSSRRSTYCSCPWSPKREFAIQAPAALKTSSLRATDFGTSTINITTWPTEMVARPS